MVKPFEVERVQTSPAPKFFNGAELSPKLVAESKIKMIEKKEIPFNSAGAEVSRLLETISIGLREILGENLIGLYLYGSAVAGDFDFATSDLDLLAATRTLIDEQAFAALDRMHRKLAAENPVWENRIEIAYVPREALKTFKTRQSKIANISPGEPFHYLEAGRDWLLNWYFVRESGVTLDGANPQSLIAPISKQEFMTAVREQAAERARSVDAAKNSRPYQAYLIMTLCRALYAVEHGEQVSKRRAAFWVASRFPEHAALIEKAFQWRAAHRLQNIDHEASFPEARNFVLEMADLIADQ